MAQPEYIQQFLKGVKVLHFALLSGMCIALGVLAYVRQTSPTPAETDLTVERILLGLAFVGAFLAFSVGSFIYRTRVNVLKNAERLEMKLEGYRAAMIIRLAMWEGVAIFASVGYFLTGNVMFVSVAVFFILLFVLMRPTTDKIAYELELSGEEKALLLADNS